MSTNGIPTATTAYHSFIGSMTYTSASTPSSNQSKPMLFGTIEKSASPPWLRTGFDERQRDEHQRHGVADRHRRVDVRTRHALHMHPHDEDDDQRGADVEEGEEVNRRLLTLPS